MKNLLYFSFLVLLMNSCSLKKKPIFIKVDNIKIISIISDTISLKANAFFENPNNLGGTISSDEIKLIINGKQVAEIFLDKFKVPAKKAFSIPLTAVIPTKRVFENSKNGILGGLINSFLNRSIKLQLKGNLKYKVFGFSNTYTIDQSSFIKI